MFLHLNLNTATSEELLLIPNMGSRMVHEFEEYRPYTSLRQFRREIGKYVNETEVARLEQYVFVAINLNTASDEAILSIPGLGDRMLRFGRGFTMAYLLFRRAVAEGLCPVFSTVPSPSPGLIWTAVMLSLTRGAVKEIKEQG